MRKRRFYSLSSILFLEILIGYGMVFAFSGDVPAEAPQKSVEEQPLSLISQHIEQGEQELQGQEQTGEESEEVLASDLQDPPAPIEIRNTELTPQGQLVNPPEVLQAIYLTSWSAGSRNRREYVRELLNTTEANAVVIDVKDFSGQVAYDTAVPEVGTYGAKKIKIWDMESFLEELHGEGVYAIARITVFQDPVLAAARPDLAVQSTSSEGVWKDYKGLGWVDPASREAWNYTVAIARDAASRGFDEINFDYIRFPSDGDLQDMQFPFWDKQTPRREVLREFFAYLKEHIQDVPISADLFGLATSSGDDLGIGQVLEDAYWHFDYVYPMVYPSHYANGYRGYPKPAEYPYEVVKYSLERAQARLAALRLQYPEEEFAALRPWLQDFDLGAEYDALMVQAQVRAVQEALGEEFLGFLLWAPTNIYTEAALAPFVFDQAAYDARERTTQDELKQELLQEEQTPQEALD